MLAYCEDDLKKRVWDRPEIDEETIANGKDAFQKKTPAWDILA